MTRVKTMGYIEPGPVGPILFPNKKRFRSRGQRPHSSDGSKVGIITVIDQRVPPNMFLTGRIQGEGQVPRTCAMVS